MTADIVNLRMARKRKARRERESEADDNRRLHGLPRAERERSDAERDRALKSLEAHRRDKPE